MYIDSLKAKEILSIQIKNGIYSPYGNSPALITLFSVVDTILTNNGYQKIAPEQMKQKIKNIYGLEPINTDFNYSLLRKCNEVLISETGEILDNYNLIQPYENSLFSALYISYTHRLVTYAFYLPEIINYLEKFPELSELEEEVLYWTDPDTNEIWDVERWKDVADLEKTQKFNQDFLIHLNRYLFNDSKASLTWLKNNNPEFLEMLVINYRYMGDKDLLKWILDKRCNLEYNDDKLKSNFIHLGKLLVGRGCDGELKFNQNVLDLAEENLSNLYMQQISTFLSLSIRKYSVLDYIDLPSYEAIPFSDQAEIYARLLYWGESIIDRYRNVKTGENDYATYANFKYVYMVHFLVYCEDWKIYEKEFERRNYYNLPKFKEYWENAKEIKREEYIDPI